MISIQNDAEGFKPTFHANGMNGLSWSAIAAIYRAGVTRGNDEATSYEWGSYPAGKYYDELIDALYDVVNEGVDFLDPSRTPYDQIRNIVNSAMSP